MADQRRGWIFIAILGLAVAYCSWKPGAESGEERAESEPNNSTDGASHMQGPRTEQEYEREVKAAREAQAERAQDRKILLQNPEIRAEWIALAHARAAGVRRRQSDFELVDNGGREFRGLIPQTVIDRKNDIRLKIDGGDSADRWTTATLTYGKSGRSVSALVSWYKDPAGYTIVSLNGAPIYSHFNDNPRPDDMPSVDSDWVRLLSWDNPRFDFGNHIGEKFVVDERKRQYYGKAGIEQYRRDLDEFLDHYVDEHYASQGKDPAHGRRNPALIGHPNARVPLTT